MSSGQSVVFEARMKELHGDALDFTAVGGLTFGEIRYISRETQFAWTAFLAALSPHPDLPPNWTISRTSKTEIRVGLASDVSVTVSESAGAANPVAYCLYALASDILDNQSTGSEPGSRANSSPRDPKPADDVADPTRSPVLQRDHGQIDGCGAGGAQCTAKEVERRFAAILPAGWTLVQDDVPIKVKQLALAAMEMYSAGRDLEKANDDLEPETSNVLRFLLLGTMSSARASILQHGANALSLTSALQATLNKRPSPCELAVALDAKNSSSVNLLDASNLRDQVLLSARMLGKSHAQASESADAAVSMSDDEPLSDAVDLAALLSHVLGECVVLDDSGRNIRIVR